MRVPRFTSRALMILVALAALLAWGCMLWRRSAQFAAMAEQHKWAGIVAELNFRTIGLNPHDPSKRLPLTEDDRVLRAALELEIQYERSLYEKYRRAARYPWLSVRADSPPPRVYEKRKP